MTSASDWPPLWISGERALFEAIAALRWILLNRSYARPLGSENEWRVVDFVHQRLPDSLHHTLRELSCMASKQAVDRECRL